MTAGVAAAYSVTGRAWQDGPGRIYDRLAAVLVAGSFVTAAGPHAGDAETPRLQVSVETVAQVHAELLVGYLGLLVGLGFALRAVAAPSRVLRRYGVLVAVVAAFHDFPEALIVWAILFLVYQQLQDRVVQPLLYRRAVQVHPVLAIVAILIGAELVGILGALLAIPVAGAIGVLIDEALDYRRMAKPHQ